MKITLREKFKYHFDNFMASGPKSIFMALILLFLFSFALAAVIRVAVHSSLSKPGEKIEANNDFWTAFLQITDPGAIAEDSEDGRFAVKVVGISTALLGLIFFSALIAFITTQLDIKIEDLKKGRSRVIEKNHILILGWGEMVTEIIRELIMANESEKTASIVVLSETPKEEMDDYFWAHIPERKSTRIITRNGVPSSLEALQRVAVTDARAVIVLPHCNDSASPEEKMISDSKVLKTILGVVAASKDDNTKANIIAEMFDKTKRDVMVNLAPDNITMVNAEDIVAKIIVQTSRSTGLSVVYSDLIGFDGSEIYFHKANWNNQSFGDLQFSFVDGIPMGISSAAGIIMNPDPSHRMKPGEELIIIAEDDSSIEAQPGPVFHPKDFALARKKLKKRIEKELIIGWNTKGPIITEQYTDYILPNSVIDIVLSEPNPLAEKRIAAIKKRNPRHKIKIIRANPLNQIELKKLKPWAYDNVVILNKMEDDTEKVDSSSITILLLLNQMFKEIAQKTGKPVQTQVISEVMNSENLELVSRTGVNDSIISYQMVSKIIAQVAQNHEILKVYDDLFQEVGSEIYLKPLDLYFKQVPGTCTFADVMKLAQLRGEVCIGYRHGAFETSIEQNFGVTINPPKDMLLQPASADRLIVIAPDET